MFVIIAIFTFLGYKIDYWLKMKFPVFLLLFIFLGLFLSLYYVFKELKNEKNNQ